ncbi:MAG: hypothetical protein AAF620_18005 [Bacteroidota bacterium]
MKTAEYFDEIHFTECDLSIRLISKDEIVIDIDNLEISKTHPLFASVGNKIKKSLLKFYDICSSEREIFEYKKDRYTNDFKEKRVEKDVEEQSFKSGANTYYIEGILDEPEAWVEWTIKANRFDLEIL